MLNRRSFLSAFGAVLTLPVAAFAKTNPLDRYKGKPYLLAIFDNLAATPEYISKAVHKQPCGDGFTAYVFEKPSDVQYRTRHGNIPVRVPPRLAHFADSLTDLETGKVIKFRRMPINAIEAAGFYCPYIPETST